jgi:calcium-independent phospholipase A2-gamma
MRSKEATDVLEVSVGVAQALALVGHAGAAGGRGVRVLSLDGGGVRGLVAVALLRRLEQLAGRPVHQLFDYIVGVSTGAIIAAILGACHPPDSFYASFVLTR